MSAAEFLDRLEEQGLLESSVVSDLRRQIESSSRGVSAEALGKLLVENGHLTRFQATRIIDEVTAREEQRRSARAETAEARRERVSASGASKATGHEDDLLNLNEMGSDLTPAGKQRDEEAEDVVMLEAAEPAQKTSPLRPLPFEPPAPQRGRAQPAASAGGLQPLAPEQELTALDEGLSSLEPASSTALGGDGLATESPRPAAGFVKKKARTNPWDSPLITVGLGVLIIMVVVSVVLWLSLNRGFAATYLEQANKDYTGGSYNNAKEKYEKYLKAGGTEESFTRVRIGMCQLHLEVEGARDPARGLDAAHRILPTIENEEQFNIAREELTVLLPRLALNFAERAQQTSRAATNEEGVVKAEAILKSLEDAMKLVDNPSNIPTTLKRTQSVVLEKITEIKAAVTRDIGRQRMLDQTLVAMDKSISTDKIRDAFNEREKLLAVFPGLASHAEIVSRVRQIGERERDLVKATQTEMTAATDDQSASVPKVVLYGHNGSGIPNVTGENIVVLVNGGAYGFDAGSGKLNWRRFVGYDSTYPQIMGTGADSGALLADSSRQELVRVHATSGEMIWRLEIGEPFSQPVLWRDRILVTTQSGRVLNVDQATGFSRRQTDLDQTLTINVGSADRYPNCYQIGENDHLYVLSNDSMESREVYYLGHRPGTIVAPPVVAVGHVFIAENMGPGHSRVHVLAVDEDGLTLAPAQEPIQLNGQVLRAPFVAGRRLVFTTTLGGIVVLDINPQSTPPAAADIAPIPPSRSQPILPFSVADSTMLWVGDSRLSAYEIQPSQAQLVRSWVAFEGSSFVAPLQRVGEAIVHVRRDPGSAGFRVSAVDGATGQTVYWQADLSFPVLDVAALPSGDVLAFSSIGSAFKIAADQISSGIAQARIDTRLAGASFDQVLPLPDNRFAFFSAAGQLLVYDPAQAGAELRLLRINIPANAVTAEPIPLYGGILVPLLSGQIMLLNPMSGDNLVLPFQPKGQPGMQVRWRKPTPVGAEQKDFVVADDQQRLYRVGVVDTGGAHLDELDRPVTLQEPVFGPLASVGDTVFAVLRRSDGDVLVFFSLPRLREEGAMPLKSPVVWGPQRVGDLVMVACENEGLLAFDQARQQVWSSPLTYGPLAGAPVEIDGDYVCAAQSGVVWRIRGSDGQEIAKHEIGEPLGGDPVIAADAIWIPGADGTVYSAPRLSP